MDSTYFADSSFLNEAKEMLLSETETLTDNVIVFQEGLNQHSAGLKDAGDGNFHSFDDQNLAPQKLDSFRHLFSEVLAFVSDDSGGIRHVCHGLSTIMVLGIILGIVLPHNSLLNGIWYQNLSSIIGYIYFTAWSISFYPQLFLNYRRKDTEGLSVDFCYLNVVGFFCYTAFNASMYWSQNLQDEYARRHDGGHIKVAPNDVAFAIHAAILSIVWVLQIWYYNGFRRKPHIITMVAVSVTVVTSLSYAVVIAIWGKHKDAPYFLSWLDFLYTLANFKVCITIFKYCPQVILNCRRRSTEGWNIWNILLDFTGGVFSVLQLVLDCWNTGDWSGITGNPAKFSLGFVSIFFDITFFVQHYILYPERTASYREMNHGDTDSKGTGELVCLRP